MSHAAALRGVELDEPAAAAATLLLEAAASPAPAAGALIMGTILLLWLALRGLLLPAFKLLLPATTPDPTLLLLLLPANAPGSGETALLRL
jgi:hypothetical protein